MSEPFDDWNEALSQDKPLEALSALARQRIADGAQRDDLVAELKRLVDALDDEERLDDADTVMEVMDFITGYSSPQNRI
jgi:hypothetical protein